MSIDKWWWFNTNSSNSNDLVSNNNDSNDCLFLTDCVEGDMRLIPSTGYHKGAGLLEVCINGTWGIICSDFFDDDDAMVACRHLGYSPLGKATS